MLGFGVGLRVYMGGGIEYACMAGIAVTLRFSFDVGFGCGWGSGSNLGSGTGAGAGLKW